VHLPEALATGRDGGKGVRFVIHAANQKSHCASPLVSWTG
jgi:hypothetical protein